MSMKVLLLVGLIVSAAVAQKSGAAPESRAAPRGGIRVDITWSGEAPATRPANIPKDWKTRNPEDAKTCDACESRGVLVDESLCVDSKTAGIRGVVVSAAPLVGATPDQALIPTKPIVRNVGCRFEPHIVLATPTDPLTVTNDDPFTHAVSVAGLGGASLTSEVIQPNGKVEIGKLTARGIYVLTCPLHGWMRGYVVVLKQGAAGISSNAGRVVLEGLTPGKRTLSIWHETLGSKRMDVEVVAGKETVLTLTQKDFPPR